MDKFCYVIVKKVNEIGCIAVKVKWSSACGLSELLDSELDVNTTQVVVLNNPDMYGRYAPYDIKDNLRDFINAVLI